MGIFQHEDMEIDLTTTTKSRLYKNNLLLFIGDGYKAISMMINYSEDKEPVKQKFHAQLTMREKPRFKSKEQDDNPL